MSIPYSRTFLFGIPWYSLLIVLGVICAIWLAGLEEKRLGLPADTALDIALVIVPCGIVGARLYYVLMSWDQFAHHPISVLYVWQGGIAIYGAVIGGGIGAWVYAWRKKLRFLTLADMVVPGLLLAQAIGRWGNYFNMEAYGPVIENPAFQFFPLGVQIPAQAGYEWHMATFFYESLWNLCGFIALWRLRKSQCQEGNVFCWYLLIYGSGRFVIEQLRQDSLMIGSLRASQYLSLILCAVAAFVLLWRACRLDSRMAFGRCFPPCLLVGATAMARWFVLGNTVWYLLLVVITLCGLIWVMAACRTGHTTTTVFLMPMLVWDVLCLRLADAYPYEPFAQLLHALVCSLTIPVLVWMLIQTVCRAKTEQSTKEEREPCP
ncbi:MAG: prolipoprotein diacylglyceryl transferase [Clostridia bacterium]|nr:prolipoprotein diacylglyceryl transferase [Clostridia bacterium]